MKDEEFASMDAWEFLDHKFESDEIKQVLSMPFTASMVNADPDAKGEGAVGLLSPFFLVAGQIKGSNGRIVDVTLKIFNEYGGEMWLNSPVESIVVENGKAVGVKMEQGSEHHSGEIIKARHAVLSNAGALQTYTLLGDDVIRAADDALATKMKNWDNKSRPSTVNVWLLKDAPKWKAATKNQYVDHADWVYLALDSIKDWNAWKDAIISGDQEGGFQGWWEGFLPGLIDPTLRGDNGEYCFRVESVAPWDVLNEKGEIDPSKWEVYKKELADRRVEVFEKFAPGFKDLVIDNVHMKSPVNFEEDNRSLVYGCAQGGAFHSEQSYLTRMPYRMPIGNLFMCNSVYPANLTWAGSGYIAASIIAEDMGIRDQDWWVTKPGQWFMENMQRLVPTGAGWKRKEAFKFRVKATIGKALGRIPTE
jgi:phytoene dehydrogenase-like protein